MTNIIEALQKQEDFVWSKQRYCENKKLTTLEGHAKKHIIDADNIERTKWDKYNNINEYLPTSEIVKKYEQISINNVKDNKYITNHIYYNDSHKSVNILGDNGLLTCLKRLVGTDELRIVSCHYKNRLFNFFNDCYSNSIEEVGTVLHFFTSSSDSQELKNTHRKYDISAFMKDFIEGEKEDRPDFIKDMIDNYYYEKKEFNKEKCYEYIKEIILRIKTVTNHIKEMAKEHYYPISELKEVVWDEREIKNITFDFPDEDYIFSSEEEFKKAFEKKQKEQEKQKEFKELFNDYDISEYLEDLAIVYIYGKSIYDFKVIDEFCNAIIVFEALDSEQNGIIKDINIIKKAIKFNEIIKINYVGTLKLLGYKTGKDIISEKLKEYNINYKEFKIKYDDLSKKYDTEIISLIKCNKCEKMNYVHTDKRNSEVTCPNCNEKDVTIIVDSYEMQESYFDE